MYLIAHLTMDAENVRFPCDRCAQHYTKRILVTGGAGFM